MAKKVTKKEESKKSAPKKEVSIPALLKELENCEDQLEKRKIRAKLRKAGHIGGVSAKGAKADTKKAKGKTKVKRGKSKKAEADED